MPDFATRWQEASAKETARKLAIGESYQQLARLKRQRELEEYSKAGNQLNLLLDQEKNPAYLGGMPSGERKAYAERRGILGDKLGVPNMGRFPNEVVDAAILSAMNVDREWFKANELTEEGRETEVRRRYGLLQKLFPNDLSRFQVRQSDVAQVRGGAGAGTAPQPSPETPKPTESGETAPSPLSEDMGSGLEMYRASMVLHAGEPMDPNQLAIRRESAFAGLVKNGWDPVTGKLVVDYEVRMGIVADTPAARAARSEDLEAKANQAASSQRAEFLNSAISWGLNQAGGTLEISEVPGFLNGVSSAYTMQTGQSLSPKEAAAVRDYAESAVKAGGGAELQAGRLYDDIIQGFQSGLDRESLMFKIQKLWEFEGGDGPVPESFMRVPPIKPSEQERLAQSALRAQTAAANAQARLSAASEGDIKLNSLLVRDASIFDDYTQLQSSADSTVRDYSEMQTGRDPKRLVIRLIEIEGGLAKAQQRGDELNTLLSPHRMSASITSRDDIQHNRAAAEQVAAMARNPKWTGTTATAALRSGGATEAEVSYFMNRFFWPLRPKPKKKRSPS